MTESQWMKIVAWVARLWPHAPLEPDTAQAWYPFVAHLDHDQVRDAIGALVLEPGRRFPPGVGDIVSTCEPTAGWWQAWRQVVDACQGEGRIRYDGDDELVDEFLSTLGPWRQQVDINSAALRAQFRDWYRQAAADRDRDRRLSDARRALGRPGPAELETVDF